MDQIQQHLDMLTPVFQYTKEKWRGDYVGLTEAGLPSAPDDNWYFWTETYCDAIGPYETKDAADLACAEYASQL